MTTLSPSVVPGFDWQLEEQMIHEIPYDDLFASNNPNETDTSHNSSGSSPQLLDFEYEDTPNLSHEIRKLPNSIKKSSHNEYERDRRKKLNELYSSLRAVLPEMDQRKKLSIPCTIARVLKYIPELQKHIERLQRTKEKLLLRMSKEKIISDCTKGMINPVISAICLNRREIMMQIRMLNISATIPFPRVAQILEGKGLRLMNATMHTTHIDKTFYALHLQAQEAIRMEGQIFCEQLMIYLSEQTVCSKPPQ